MLVRSEILRALACLVVAAAWWLCLALFAGCAGYTAHPNPERPGVTWVRR